MTRAADRGGLPGRGHRLLGRPAQRRPAVHPVPAPPPRPAGARGGARPGRRGQRSPAPPTCCGRTSPRSTSSPTTCSGECGPSDGGVDRAALATQPGRARQPGRCAGQRSPPGPPPPSSFKVHVDALVDLVHGAPRPPGAAARSRHGVPSRTDLLRFRPTVHPESRGTAVRDTPPHRLGGQCGRRAHRGRPGRTSSTPRSEIQAPAPRARATRCRADYDGHDLLLVGVLKGAVMVMADLARTFDRHVEMDWMAVSSYGSGTKSSGVVRILKDLDTDITGRHVLIVEDIIDTGLTLSWLVVEPEVPRPRVGRDLHAAAQARRPPDERRREVRRLRHPQRLRRRLRPRLRRALPQPALRRHARPRGLLLSPRPAPVVASARDGVPSADLLAEGSSSGPVCRRTCRSGEEVGVRAPAS